MIHKGKDIYSNLTLDCDVCVIGSGAGGGCVASELAEAGMKVVVLEEGPYIKSEEFNTDTMSSVKKLYRDGGNSVAIGNSRIVISEGRCVGGSTVINSGMCYRTPSKVLKKWHWEYGIENILPEDMETYFDKVEKRINVSHEQDWVVGKDSMLFKKGAENLKYKVVPNRRNQIVCCGCNNCVLGCPSGAKQSTLVSYIPLAVKHGAELYSDCKAISVGKSNGKINYVEGVFMHDFRPSPYKIRVNCDTVVLTGGATQSPLFLLKNRIANSSGQVGKNLYLHPSFKLGGLFKDEIYGWKGSPQSYQVHEFLDEGILLSINFVPPELISLSLPYVGEELFNEMKNLNRMMILGALVEDSHPGQVKLSLGKVPVISYNITKEDMKKFVYSAALLAEITFEAGADKVYLPFGEKTSLNSKKEIKSLFNTNFKPQNLEMLTFHLMGSCRMGNDPQSSVVDNYGRSHDIPNLFIADASVFPSPIGINPMVTIQALATRTAEHIIKKPAERTLINAR